jgi:DNA-binding transcriptional ArsR family regulator
MKTADMIWKTCRILANETRLKILCRLLHGAELCVSDIADTEKISRVVASQNLRLLYETGFLKPNRKSKWVFYRAEVPDPGTLAEKLYFPLKKELFRGPSNLTVLLKTTTALTHPRRVDLIQKLLRGPASFEELIPACDISGMALHRHLEKLVRRNFIVLKNDRYRIVHTTAGLHGALLALCKEGIHTS